MDYYIDNLAMDYYMPSKDLGPLVHGWSLGNAIGLFSMDTIMPEGLNLDGSDEMVDLSLDDLPINTMDLGSFTMPKNNIDDTFSHVSTSSVCILCTTSHLQ